MTTSLVATDQARVTSKFSSTKFVSKSNCHSGKLALASPTSRIQSWLKSGFGDLARLANIQDSNERLLLRFSTDALGFRNEEGSRRAAGILFGDSFALAGDDDRETLSAQLG